MHETTEDVQELQALLDRSFEAAGDHLRSIITPERRVTAAHLVERLSGMRLLSLATVTVSASPSVWVALTWGRDRMWVNRTDVGDEPNQKWPP